MYFEAQCNSVKKYDIIIMSTNIFELFENLFNKQTDYECDIKLTVIISHLMKYLK